MTCPCPPHVNVVTCFSLAPGTLPPTEGLHDGLRNFVGSSAAPPSTPTLLPTTRPELAAQVEKLMAATRRLPAEGAEAKEFEEENLQLRRLLKLDPPAAWRYVAAEVILRDPVLWNEHFTIDRGSRDGLTKGSAVISVTPDGRPRWRR